MTQYTMDLIDCYDPLTPIYNELAREPWNFTLFHEMTGEEINMTPIWGTK